MKLLNHPHIIKLYQVSQSLAALWSCPLFLPCHTLSLWAPKVAQGF